MGDSIVNLFLTASISQLNSAQPNTNGQGHVLPFVGWYLIHPPIVEGKVRPDLPINQWKISTQEFADVQECNRFRDAYLKATSDAFWKTSDRVPHSMIESIVQGMNQNTRCARSKDIGLGR